MTGLSFGLQEHRDVLHHTQVRWTPYAPQGQKRSVSLLETMARRILSPAFRLLHGGLKAVAGFLFGEWWSARRVRQAHLIAHVERPRSVVRVIRGRLMVKGWGLDTVRKVPAPVRALVGDKTLCAMADWQPDLAGPMSHAGAQSQAFGFTIPIIMKPGVRLLTIQAQAADGRWVTLRRTLLVVRGESRPRRSYLKYRSNYRCWHKREARALGRDVQEEIQRHIATMTVRPTFTIVIDCTRGTAGVADTLRSLQGQVYLPHEVCGLGVAETDQVARLFREHGGGVLPDARVEEIQGSHCVFVDAASTLHSHALYEFASAINASPAVDIIYADEDVIDFRGRHTAPFFKPDWSPDYLEVFNYIEFPCCYRSDAVASVYRDRCLYSLALRVTESAREVVHIPKVLGHRRHPPVTAREQSAGVSALLGRLERTGRKGRVAPHPVHRGCYTIHTDFEQQPRVSVIIPTAGRSFHVGGRLVDLVTNLIVQIRTRTTYGNVEIIVVDNGTLTETQAMVLREHGCRSVTYTDSEVNIARKINQGAEQATGRYLLIVNDDIEILTPDWIERMSQHFQKPDVAVVGCRLLYHNGTLQHAGVVFVNGHPTHVRKWMPGGEAGYFFSSCAARNYLAVTGACMMTSREVFFAVGGYDETFPLNFNDVDYCLKVRQRGQRVVYEGGAALTHLESISRPPADDAPHLDIFARRWAAEIAVDPYYNDRVLNLHRPAFEPELNPRQI